MFEFDVMMLGNRSLNATMYVQSKTETCAQLQLQDDGKIWI